MRLAAMAAALFLWTFALPALAQEDGAPDIGPEAQGQAESGGEDGATSGNNIEVTLDPELDKEFLVIEAVVQIAVLAAEAEGRTLDVAKLETDLLARADTDRQKAYVHLRIAEIYYQRKNYQAAIDSLEKGLPLADGDRDRESLYFRILRSLLITYDRAGRINEAGSHIRTYREILSADVDPWQRLAGSEDVIHKPSGIRLPHRLNLFTRERLIVFDDTGRDAGATYRAGDASLPELSVYLVSEIGETAEAHFEGALGAILNRFAGAQVLSRGVYAVETEKGAVEGFAARVSVPGEGYTLGLGSDLYVFVVKGILIKFRISFHAQERTEIEAVMTEIFRDFDWP